MNSRNTLLAALAAGLVAVAPAAAQKTPPGLLAGSTVTGALERGDPTASDGSYYDLWMVRASAGEVLTFTMRSSDFDAYLAIGETSGGEFKLLESDDDGAGGTDARLSFTVPRAGDYLIRANTLSAGETGSYRLSLESASGGGGGGVTGSASQLLTAGQTVNGRLSQTDLRLGDDSYYDAYRFQGRAGERVTLTMRSSDFDTYLAIGRGSGDAFEEVESDDDGAGGTDSRLEITLPASGEYEVHANSLSRNVTGAYTLLLSSGGGGGGGTVAGAASISLGQTVNGALSTNDRTLDDGSHYDELVFQGAAGQQVTITMRSSAFDAFLSVGRGSGAEYNSLETDDDSAGGTDARLTVTLPASGAYVIRANSLSAGSTGSYSVSLSTGGK
jgi:hypothetical protein